jgi:hypothetical protein
MIGRDPINVWTSAHRARSSGHEYTWKVITERVLLCATRVFFFNTGISAFFTLIAGITTDLKKVMR